MAKKKAFDFTGDVAEALDGAPALWLFVANGGMVWSEGMAVHSSFAVVELGGAKPKRWIEGGWWSWDGGSFAPLRITRRWDARGVIKGSVASKGFANLTKRNQDSWPDVLRLRIIRGDTKVEIVREPDDY